eukprot:10155535-Lingulodinium_polyedra.AAC.1
MARPGGEPGHPTHTPAPARRPPTRLEDPQPTECSGRLEAARVAEWISHFWTAMGSRAPSIL